MIIVKFGAGNMVHKDVESYSTSAEVLEDRALIQVLTGSTDSGSLEASVNGIRGDFDLNDGDVVELHTKAHTKGC